MGCRKGMGCESVVVGCNLPETRVFCDNGNMHGAKTPLLEEGDFEGDLQF